MPYALKCEGMPLGRMCENESKYEIEVMNSESSLVSFAVCGACYDRAVSAYEGAVTVVAHRRDFRK